MWPVNQPLVCCHVEVYCALHVYQHLHAMFLFILHCMFIARFTGHHADVYLALHVYQQVYVALTRTSNLPRLKSRSPTLLTLTVTLILTFRTDC